MSTGEAWCYRKGEKCKLPLVLSTSSKTLFRVAFVGQRKQFRSLLQISYTVLCKRRPALFKACEAYLDALQRIEPILQLPSIKN